MSNCRHQQSGTCGPCREVMASAQRLAALKPCTRLDCEEDRCLRYRLEIETDAHAEAVKAHLYYKNRSQAAEKERDHALSENAALREAVRVKDLALRPFALAFNSPTKATKMITLHDLRLASVALALPAVEGGR